RTARALLTGLVSLTLIMGSTASIANPADGEDAVADEIEAMLQAAVEDELDAGDGARTTAAAEDEGDDGRAGAGEGTDGAVDDGDDAASGDDATGSNGEATSGDDASNDGGDSDSDGNTTRDDAARTAGEGDDAEEASE